MILYEQQIKHTKSTKKKIKNMLTNKTNYAIINLSNKRK